MRFIYDNLAPLYLAIMTSALAWMYGGTRAGVILSVVPWLLLFLLEVLFFFPQKHSDESTYSARERVWHHLKRDPLVWVCVGFLALLAIPFVNNGLCVNCDWKLIALGHSPDPTVKFLPFCVNRLQHLNVFLWFAAAVGVLIGVRHALTRHGKVLLVKLLVWNGFALAILGFIQTACEAPGPLWQEMTNVRDTSSFFSTFGYPNMAGDYFTTLFALAIAVWRHVREEVADDLRRDTSEAQKSPHLIFWRKNLYLMPAAVFFFAAVNTLSRAAMILVTSLLALAFIHAFISFAHRLSRAAKVRRGTLALAILGLSVFFCLTSLPKEVQREVETLDADTILTRVTSKGQYHARVSTEIWKDHFLFGCGGWGYKHFCVPKMTPEELKHIQRVGGINVHNDYLQFLAEHGIVGFGLMLVIVLFLLAPVLSAWRHLASAARFVKSREAPPRPIAIFALPAPAFFLLAGALATFIHGFGDCPLRSPAVLALFVVSLSTIPGFLPKEDHDHATC